MTLLSRWTDAIMGRGDAAVTVPPMDGALRPNQILEQASATPAISPDNLVFWRDQIHYSSGRELRRLGSATVVREFAQPIMCLAGANDGRLAVGLAGAGVVLIGTDDAAVSLPVGITNPTATAFVGSELIVCEGSRRHGGEAWSRDLMETGHRGSGQGSVWKLTDLTALRIADGLRYPNGVAALADNRIVVSEAWSHRLFSMGLAPSSPPVTVLGDLPGYPARIASASDGGLWLAIAAPRSQLVEFVLREKTYRKRMIAEIAPELWIAPALSSGRSFLEPMQGGAVKQMGMLKPWAPSRSYGLVIKLDVDFQPVLSMHSRADGTRHGTTSVLESDGVLHVASRGGDAILSVPLGELAAS